MYSKSCKTFVLAIAAFLVFSTAALARDHHQLNGTWRLIPSRSELNGEQPFASGTVTINDHGRNIYLAQQFGISEPQQSVSAGFTIDGHENSVIRRGSNFWGMANWENDSLHVQTTENGVTSTERFMLRPDGTMAMDFIRPGHQPVTLFFERE